MRTNEQSKDYLDRQKWKNQKILFIEAKKHFKCALQNIDLLSDISFPAKIKDPVFAHDIYCAGRS